MHNVINRIDEMVLAAPPPLQTQMHKELRATIERLENIMKKAEVTQ